jgi:hypothetical protein
MRRARPSRLGRPVLAALIVVAAAGCLDGFAPLEGPVARPLLDPGTWWTVHVEEWAGDDPPWLVRDETYWVVGARDVEGVPWPVAVVVESVALPPFPPGPFRLVLLPPSRATVEGGVRSEVWPSQDVVECRGVDACPTESLLAGDARWWRALPFPLAEDYRLSYPTDGGFAAVSYENVTGHVVGQAGKSYPFGAADVVRVEEHATYHGFEHGGYADAAIDYARGLGLVVRERETSCALPLFSLCGGTGGRSLDVTAHGWLQPPSMAEVGQRFAVEQSGMVRGQGIVVEGNRANVAAGETVTAKASFVGLRPGDTVEVRFTPQRDAGNASTVLGPNATFAPAKPGWYDLAAIVRGPQGVPIGLEQREFRAVHDGRTTVSCDPSCPTVTVPMGPGVQNVAVTAHTDAVLGSGRLEVRDGAGQLQGTCTCPEVQLGVLADQTRDWTALWIPEVAGVGSTVAFHIVVE